MRETVLRIAFAQGTWVLALQWAWHHEWQWMLGAAIGASAWTILIAKPEEDA